MRNHKRPDWAQWRSDPATPEWTLGVEEEVMLLDPSTWSLAPVIDELLPSLSHDLVARVAAETNAATLELATGVHTSVDDAFAELGSLRRRLRLELATVGLRAASAGTHPMHESKDSRVSGGAHPVVPGIPACRAAAPLRLVRRVGAGDRADDRRRRRA